MYNRLCVAPCFYSQAMVTERVIAMISPVRVAGLGTRVFLQCQPSKKPNMLKVDFNAE
jgi:hypothetical protein